jgi:hypothetical protein
MEDNKKEDLEHLSEIENLEDDDISDNTSLSEMNILDQSDGSNSQDEIDGNDVDDIDQVRTTHVTRSGRHVKMRKDLFDNYEFTQKETPQLSAHPNIEAMSTQWSLKQGLRYYPKETKDAVMSELMQLHHMNVFEPIQQSSMTKQETLGALNTITFVKKKRCGRIKA